MENQENSTPTPREDSLAGFQLAMVYAPEQPFEELYTPENALLRGTLFAALDKPLVKGGK